MGRRTFALGAAGVVALASCTPADAPRGANGTAPPIRSVAVDTSAGPLFRSLRVTADAPESVQVEYWTNGAPHLKVTAFDSGTGPAIYLPRLRPGATYSYEVRAIGTGGALGAPYAGSLMTGALPAELAGYAFRVQGAATFPLAMVELYSPTYSAWVMVDSAGQVVWYRKACDAQGFTRRANGDFVMLDGCDQAGLYEVAPDGRVVDSLPNAYGMNHDVITTAQNTLLFIGVEYQTVGDTAWKGDDIWEWSPETGTVVKRWDAFDFLSPATDRGTASMPDDWLHANSLAIGPSGNVIVSFLNLGQVISLSPDFSAIAWRLGGPNSTLAADSDAEPYGQHTAAEISPGHILMFDNMTFDSLTASHHSRGLEVVLDTVAHVAHKVWEFRQQPDAWTPILGSDRLLPNGDRVVSFGLSKGIVGSAGPIAAYEVTPAGAVIWRLEVDGPTVNYRTTPLESVGGEVRVQ